MRTGPGEWSVADAAGRGRLRVSDADRERVIDILKTAFVQGKLTRDELGRRAGQALESRTYGELSLITAGLIEARSSPKPVRPSARRPVRRPVPSVPRKQHRKRHSKKRAATWAACVILPPALGAAFLTYYGGFIVLFVFTLIGAIATAGPTGASVKRRG